MKKFFPFRSITRFILTFTNLSAHPIIRSSTKSHILDKIQRAAWKIVSCAQNHAGPFLCKAHGQGFSLKSGWIRARRFIRRQIVVCHFYVCSRTRGRREGWLKSATALSRKKQAREQKKKRIVCHIPWAGCENRAEGGAIGNTWARCRFLFSSLSPSLFCSHPPFLPSFLSFPVFHPFAVCNNWDFYVTSKEFGFLFTEEIHFIISLFLFPSILLYSHFSSL